MKISIRHFIVFFLLVEAVSINCALFANDVSDQKFEMNSVSIEAPIIDYFDNYIKAHGGVKFKSGKILVNADEVEFNYIKNTGQMTNAIFTTCSELSPHYRVNAKNISIDKDNVIRARKISIFIGNFKLISLPYYKAEFLGDVSKTTTLPRPGYNKSDGITLGQFVSIVDNNRTILGADTIVTSKRGIHLGIIGEMGVDGVIGRLNGRSNDYVSFRDSIIKIGDISAVKYANSIENKKAEPIVSRLRMLGNYSVKTNTFDIETQSLVYDTRPEIGLRYYPNSISLTKKRINPRIALAPMFSTSWGHFKEMPSNYGIIDRTNIKMELPFGIGLNDGKSAITPMIGKEWSRYDTDDEYRISTYSLDYSKTFNNDSMVELRYVKRDQSGKTPFEFDDVDIKKEVWGGFQMWRGRRAIGLVTSYDVQKKKIYDWEIMFGHRTDCFAFGVSWNGRVKRLFFDVALIGL